MPTTSNGVTAYTQKRMILDAGCVYKNLSIPALTGTKLGATSGGNKFEIEQEDVVPEIDGAPGPLKGTRRPGTSIARLTCNFIEISEDTLLMKLAGSASATSGDYVKITRTTQPVILDAAYFTNIALVVTHSSNANVPFIVVLKNVLGENGMEMEMEDKGNAKLEAVFVAHYDPTSMDDEPWEIYLPGSAYVS